MQRVLYFSDGGARGIGATIRLDNGSPCTVRCASIGVRVKRTRWGWFGPVLFEEKNVEQAARTAMVLAVQFPNNLLPMRLNNPVLRAFTNAIMHCSSSPEVANVLKAANREGAYDKLPDNALLKLVPRDSK